MYQLFDIIFGAVISAFVGVLSAYLTGRIREQEWKKESIYKPLYLELCSLSTTKWFDSSTDFSMMRITTIDDYSKLHIDRDLRNALDKWKSKLEEYKKKENECREIFESESTLQDLENAVKRALSHLLTEDKKSILLEKQNEQISIEVKRWVRRFGKYLLRCGSGEELYKSLVESPEGRVYDQYFKKWWTENPEIFEALIRECSNIKSYSEYKTIYQELQNKYNEIIDFVNELKIKLEKRIKRVL